MGHGARGLQRRRRRLVVLHPGPGPVQVAQELARRLVTTFLRDGDGHGWTGLVARLIQSLGQFDAATVLDEDRWPLARPYRRGLLPIFLNGSWRRFWGRI